MNKIATSKKSNKKTIRNKRETPTSENSLWKRVYIIICVFLLVLTLNQLFLVTTHPSSGWDYRVYMGAVQSLDHNLDPYITENIIQFTGEDLGFGYPPHILFFFKFLSFFQVFQSIWIYYLFLVIFLILSGYVIIITDEKHHYLFLITILMTGFMGTFWNFLTGNKEIIYLFLFATIFYLLVKEKFYHSSFVMGLVSSIALTTIPFSAIYVVVNRSIMERLKMIIISICVPSAILLVCYLVNPSLFLSFIHSVSSSSIVFNEPGGWNNPTPNLMFGDVLKRMNIESTVVLAVISLLYIGLVIGAAYHFIIKNFKNNLKVYSMAILAIFMIWPRIKPYDFVILIVPLYFLFKECSYKVKILVITVITLPLFVWYYPFPLDSLPFFVYPYAQAESLFIIFMFLIIYDHYVLVKHEISSNKM